MLITFSARSEQTSLLAKLFLVILCISGCAANGSKLSSDVSRLQRELNDVRGFQAEQTTQISSLQSDLRNLQGRIEELEHGQNMRMAAQAPLAQPPTGYVGDPGNNPGAPYVPPPRPKGPPPPIVPLSALEEDESLVPAIPGEAGRLFGEALYKIREGTFADALALLQEALAQSYNSKWYPNVLFWIGVSNDGLPDLKSALRSYHELIAGFPNSSRVPLALLRQGSVFIRLGDSPSARLTFEKLISQYPKSTEAAAARDRLKDLRR
ncbi:MAG: tetratricopeptide repeat protein [Oligoflexia bacterium]|nr:tetratricopeptide repeat protein [Oligoflexia bacterium]